MRRIRRTNKVLDEDIMNAIQQLINEVGYANITLTDILHQARIEPNVFYNRFSDLDAAFDEFTKQYDYWFGEVLLSNVDENADVESTFLNMFTNLIDALSENKTMQRILIWELSEDNETTRRTAQQRDSDSERLVDFYLKALVGDPSKYRVRTALLIGGIYYLILHKDRSTFCGIDFTTEEGKNLMKDVVADISRTGFLFDRDKDRIKEYNIAHRLKTKGVDIEIISECTGLTIDEVKRC